MHLFDMIGGDETPNIPAAPHAGISSRLTIEHHGSGVGEPERQNETDVLLALP